MLYQMADRVTSGRRERKDLVGQVIQRQRYRRLVVILIRPSKYDDEGYVVRFWRGVLPGNSLNVLNGLTEDVKRRGVFGDLAIQVDTFDETAEQVPVKRIARWSRRTGTGWSGITARRSGRY